MKLWSLICGLIIFRFKIHGIYHASLESVDFELRTLVLHYLYLRSLGFIARNLELWTLVCGLTMFRFWVRGIYYTSLESVDFELRTLILHYLDLISLDFNARNLEL